MSLEQALQQNTNAILSLVAILSQADNQPNILADANRPQAAVGINNTASNTDEVTIASPEVAAEKPVEAKTETTTVTTSTVSADASAAGVTYQDAAIAVQNLAKEKGRDAAVAVLKTFGAEKLFEIQEIHYPEVIAACKAA